VGREVWYHDLEQYTSAKGQTPPFTNRPPRSIYACPAFERLPDAYWDLPSIGYNVSGAAVPFTKSWGLGLGGEVLVDPGVPILPPTGYRANRESEVLKPTDMIGLGDGWLDHLAEGRLVADGILGDALHVDPVAPSSTGWFANGSLQKRRHDGRFNIWFCDGHAESLPFWILISRDDDKLRRWNNDNLPHRNLVR
jgi:prepilin-type processing-associated H-X9-DG protein